MFDLTSGQQWMLWSIRITVLLYIARYVIVFVSRRQRPVDRTRECWGWTIAWCCYCAHVLLAFHFVHDWSHYVAWQHTADETARVTGIRRGDGVWVNYAFTLAWLADVIRIWAYRTRPQAAASKLSFAFQAAFAFIVFNATVVFGPPIYRYLAVPVAGGLFWIWKRPGVQRESES